MTLRGKPVLARCDAAGALQVEGGRVEIRYGRASTKAYRAAPRNLQPGADATIFPDDHCAEATAAEGAKGRKGGKKAPRKKGAGGPPPTKPTEGQVLGYCDGACSGNPGPAGIGAVILWDDERHVLSEYLGRATNNIAELTAIERIVDKAPRGRPLHVYTDSTYSIGVLTGGWRAKKNQELVARVKRALAEHGDVELHHVRGHAGAELNELADQLAVQAVETRKSTGWVAG